MKTWHYNKDGTTSVGPVSEHEFLQLIKQGEVRIGDLVWTEGMEEWKRAEDVPGLFAPPLPSAETRQPPPTSESSEETLPPGELDHNEVTTKVILETTDSAGEFDAKFETNPTFLSYRGRLRRRTFFLQVFPIAFPILYGKIMMGVPSLMLGGAFILLGCAILISFPFVKRLHDMNLSGRHYWIVLIPGANFIFGLGVLLARGSVGPNGYGPDPRD